MSGMSGAGGAELSIIVPVYNEEENLEELYRRLQDLMDSLPLTSEVILVNDGSRDGTGEMVAGFSSRSARFRSIHLVRNFGHQAAVSAGLRHAGGRAVVVMDADLQDPPELVGDMVARWREGYEVVYARRRTRDHDPAFKRALAWGYYRILRRLTDVDIPTDVGDFCLMDRRVVDQLNALPEQNRYLRGLRAWLGFRQTAVEFDRASRFAGAPKYTFWKSLRLAVDGVVSFSKIPLRLGTYLGLIVSALSFVLAVAFIVEKVFVGVETRGWASTVVILLFLGGVQLLTLGIIGEYLSRVYDEVKQRPQFIVRETIGFTPPAKETAPPPGSAPGRS